jgi:hypothetical protein
MPSIWISDWAGVRLSTISFFGAMFLLATAVVRWLWNGLARDFPKMPRLTYRRALAAVALWSMLLAVVLTMIAGSRELLTPGAWQKRGVLYEVASQKPPATATDTSPTEVRKEHLRRFQAALLNYATQHEGHFPAADAAAAIEPALWQVPGGFGLRYAYVPGGKTDKSSRVLAYEPEFDGSDRLVFQTNGEIVAITSAELRRRLAEEKQP